MLRRSFFGLLASIPFVGKAFGNSPTPALCGIPVPATKKHYLNKYFEKIFCHNKVVIEEASFGKAFIERFKFPGKTETTKIRIYWKYIFNDGEAKQVVSASLSRTDAVLLRETLNEAISRIDALNSGDDSKWEDNQPRSDTTWKSSTIGEFKGFFA